MNKRKMLFPLIVILIAGIFFAVYYFVNSKPIETMSANIVTEPEIVKSEFGGVIKNLKENKSEIKFGDVIAEIDLSGPKKLSCTQTSTSNKKAAAEYEDAAMRYKEGVITKEEYDVSLNTYKEKAQNDCNAKEDLKPIIAAKDGVIVFEKDIYSGAIIQPETKVAEIVPKNAEIKAYFSPKNKKKIKSGSNAEIIIVKYPEKIFKGRVTNIESVDIYGLGVKILIDDDITDLSIQNNDSAIVKILRK